MEISFIKSSVTFPDKVSPSENVPLSFTASKVSVKLLTEGIVATDRRDYKGQRSQTNAMIYILKCWTFPLYATGARQHPCWQLGVARVEIDGGGTRHALLGSVHGTILPSNVQRTEWGWGEARPVQKSICTHWKSKSCICWKRKGSVHANHTLYWQNNRKKQNDNNNNNCCW